MEKLYVNEISRNGEVSTVGLFYCRGEAENIVAQLRSIAEKSSCRYEITATPPSSAKITPRRSDQERAEK